MSSAASTLVAGAANQFTVIFAVTLRNQAEGFLLSSPDSYFSRKEDALLAAKNTAGGDTCWDGVVTEIRVWHSFDFFKVDNGLRQAEWDRETQKEEEDEEDEEDEASSPIQDREEASDSSEDGS